MKHLLPSESPSEQTRARHRLQNLPFKEWKANITDYLGSISWTQWGFVIIATFGYLFYLVLAVSIGIFLETVLFLMKLILRVHWDDSVERRGVAYWIVYWTQHIFLYLIRPLTPPRVWVGFKRRMRAYQIPSLVLRGAAELARPNRVTFVIGCLGLAMLAFAFAQEYWFPPDAPVPSTEGTYLPDAPRGVNDYD